eukprot:5179212-Heterocapsa_arctica.AAC.2
MQRGVHGASRAEQSDFRVSDHDLTHDYGTLRQGVFTFLARGRAFGLECQLQGTPMELDTLTTSLTRSAPGKGKGGGAIPMCRGGPKTTPSGRG